jgi:hypothetical protein
VASPLLAEGKRQRFVDEEQKTRSVSCYELSFSVPFCVSVLPRKAADGGDSIIQIREFKLNDRTMRMAGRATNNDQ